MDAPAKPELPTGAAGDPVLLVPIGTRVGFVMMPATDLEHPEVPQEPLRAFRFSFDTVVGTVHVAMVPDAAVELAKAMAQVLNLSEPTRIQAATGADLRAIAGGRAGALDVGRRRR